MGLKTIAILSPGDMGHGVGKALVERGYDVITCLAGRSQRTRRLAETAGLREVPSLEHMTVQADLIMSILAPDQAVGVAREVADAMQAAGTSRPFADCNAVSPKSASVMASIISAAADRRLHRRWNHRRFTGQRSDSSNLHVRFLRRHYGRA